MFSSRREKDLYNTARREKDLCNTVLDIAQQRSKKSVFTGSSSASPTLQPKQLSAKEERIAQLHQQEVDRVANASSGYIVTYKQTAAFDTKPPANPTNYKGNAAHIFTNVALVALIIFTANPFGLAAAAVIGTTVACAVLVCAGLAAMYRYRRDPKVAHTVAQTTPGKDSPTDSPEANKEHAADFTHGHQAQPPAQTVNFLAQVKESALCRFCCFSKAPDTELTTASSNRPCPGI